MHKLSHNLVDISTEGHLIPNSEKRTSNSHAFKYRVPEVSKDVFQFSFFPRSITEWSSLPADLVNCNSLSDFKLNLVVYIYIFFMLAFFYSWCDVLPDFINLINVDVDVEGRNGISK